MGLSGTLSKSLLTPKNHLISAFCRRLQHPLKPSGRRCNIFDACLMQQTFVPGELTVDAFSPTYRGKLQAKYMSDATAAISAPIDEAAEQFIYPFVAEIMDAVDKKLENFVNVDLRAAAHRVLQETLPDLPASDVDSV